MAIELINVGAVANDGTGDDLREAFIKINQNFEELDLRDDEQTTASNVGLSGVGIFAQKINYDLQFRKLVAGTDITLTVADNQIVVDANGGLKTIQVISDSGSKLLESITHINVLGGENISTRIQDSSLHIDYTGPTTLAEDPSPQLSSVLNANTQDITNVNNIDATQVTSGSFIGNLTGNVYGIDIRNISTYFEPNNFDMGGIVKNINNIVEWVLSEMDIDFGTFTNPDLRSVDLGSLV